MRSRFLPSSNRWYILVLLVGVYLSNHIDRQILSILLEPIKQEFGASDTMMGILTGPAFALFYTLAGIPIARWADRGMRTRIITISITIWSLLTALSGVAGSYAQLAVLRIGIGIGEAGCVPPSHSLISDLFPAKQRGRALAIYLTGASAGAAFGMLVGGLLYSNLGWRMSFIVVGLPGLLLAMLVYFTVREPERGRWDRGASTEPVQMGAALKSLWTQRSYVHAQIAGALHSTAVWAILVWLVPFFMRVHSMELASVTTLLGIGMLVVTIPGIFLSGVISDRLSQRDQRWYVWLPTVAALIGAPCTLLFLFMPNPLVAICFYFVHQVFASSHAAPVNAMTQSVVPVRVRAFAVAIHLLCINLIGMGLGPLLIGTLNDQLRDAYGDLAIRYTMIVAVVLSVASCVFYMWASRTVRADIARAHTDSPNSTPATDQR